MPKSPLQRQKFSTATYSSIRICGALAGERSFAAHSPTVHQPFFPRTLANDRRTLSELPRTLTEPAANWKTVRQKSVFTESSRTGLKHSANYCSPRTTRVKVRVMVMVNFNHNPNRSRGTIVCGERTTVRRISETSPKRFNINNSLANCSPARGELRQCSRQFARREEKAGEFAANERSIAG